LTMDGSRARVLADQAIFTSIRSPTGTGYRIIAASPGVRAEERVEITRRSPSHGSLYDNGSAAAAVAAYPLPTGRHCVAWSRTAGLEHTGRGGERIYTHILLLDTQAFDRFGCNPIAVRQAAPSIAEGPPLLKPPAALPPLELIPRCRPTTAAPGHLCADLLCAAAAELLAGGRLVVQEEPAAMDGLEWALMLLPLAVRRKLPVSVGLKTAPTRPVHLAWTGHEQNGNGRCSPAHGVRVLRREQLAGGGVPSPTGWFGLLRRWWQERRWDDIHQLNDELTTDVRTPDLERLAAICDALDEVAVADAGRLECLATHVRDAAGHEVVEKLRQRLVRSIEERRELLKRQEELLRETAQGQKPAGTAVAGQAPAYVWKKSERG
jgi:hypothetical protein